MAERSDYEQPVLSKKMRRRAAALREARKVLESRSVKGPFTAPSTEAPISSELIEVAHWIVTGEVSG